MDGPRLWPIRGEAKQTLAKSLAEKLDVVYLLVPRPLQGSRHAPTG